MPPAGGGQGFPGLGDGDGGGQAHGAGRDLGPGTGPGAVLEQVAGQSGVQDSPGIAREGRARQGAGVAASQRTEGVGRGRAISVRPLNLLHSQTFLGF